MAMSDTVSLDSWMSRGVLGERERQSMSVIGRF